MSKIRVGYSSSPAKAGVAGAIRDEDGRVLKVHAQGYRPRMPSDGSCGCKRDRAESEGYLTVHIINICEKHGRDPRIVEFCLKPPRDTRDPGLTP